MVRKLPPEQYLLLQQYALKIIDQEYFCFQWIRSGASPELMDTPKNLYYWIGGAYGEKVPSFQP